MKTHQWRLQRLSFIKALHLMFFRHWDAASRGSASVAQIGHTRRLAGYKLLLTSEKAVSGMNWLHMVMQGTGLQQIDVRKQGYLSPRF